MNNRMMNLLDSIHDNFVTLEKDGFELKKIHKSYIESLAPIILQSGLIPAIAMYERDRNDPNTRSEGDRSEILDWIWDLIKLESENNTLYLYLTKISLDNEKLDLAKQNILECLMAMKLYIRTYKFN